MIVNALAGKPLPIYGDGLNVRDWLYVKDHCSAIRAVLAKGRPGEVYNIGGWNERTNRQIVDAICAHDPDAAQRAMLQHLEKNRAEISYVAEELSKETVEE